MYLHLTARNTDNFKLLTRIRGLGEKCLNESERKIYFLKSGLK